MSGAPKGEGRWTMATKPASLDMPAAGMGHDEDVPGADKESVRAGHEPDWFNARGVIFVPIGVAIAAAMTYGVVTLLFAAFTPGKPAADKTTNPQAVEENSKPYDQRVTRISSQDPNAPVKQPRLEWLRTVEGKTKDEPVYYRSMKSPDMGNSPEIRPEDLRPENYVDWNTGKKVLSTYEWVDQAKGVARIPVNEAIRILATQKKLPAKPVAGGHPTGATTREPKLSNGGQTETAAMEAVHEAHDDGHKKDDHGHKDEPKKDEHKDEHKKEEPKKEAPKSDAKGEKK